MALPCFLALFLALAASATRSADRTRRSTRPDVRFPRSPSWWTGPLGVATTTTDAEGRFTLRRPGRRQLSRAGRSPRLCRPGQNDPDRHRHVRHRHRSSHVAPYSEAVVVAAAPVPRPRSESPASTTVVGSDAVKARQLETVADALRTTPGFAVGRNGGRGALTSVFPRGGESDYTLVLVDGIRVNNFGGGLDFSLLPLGDLDQIEIVRGPQSAIFGADAIGGVVHLTTRQGGQPTVSGQFEGGGQATVRGLGATRGTVGGLVVWRERRATTRATASPASRRPPARSSPTTTGSSRSPRATWNGRKSATTAVRADLRWLDAERGNPGPFGSNPIGAYTAVDRVSRGEDTQQQIGLHGRLPWGSSMAGRIQQRWQVTVADLDNRYHSPFGDSFFETRRTGAPHADRRHAVADDGPHRRRRGLRRARTQHLHHRRGLPGSPDRAPHLRRASGGALRTWARAPAFSVGLRADSIRRDALEGNPDPFGPRPAFDQRVGDLGEPASGQALHRLAGQRGAARTTVRASYGTGIRPPDAFELAFTDNPALQPERSRSADIGVSHVLVPQVTRRRHRLLQPLRRPDRRGRGGVCRREPLPHRQHLQRPGARAGT